MTILTLDIQFDNEVYITGPIDSENGWRVVNLRGTVGNGR